ncbi:MAG TPA: S53 family peptidase [Candidatus Dormibacteraeota bacterium]
MRSITSWTHALVARAAAVALAVPMVLGGAVPASAAIVSHAMTPAVGSSVRYEYIGSSEDAGQVKFACQLRSRDPNFPRAFCYGPDQIRAAYDVQSVLAGGTNGAGQTIVIVDAFSSPTITTDLKAWDAIWGIPDPTLNIITPDGLTPFDINSPNQVGWSSEISLDVEWAHAIAPGATIDLVLAKSSDDADILRATRYAVDNNLGDVISQSFGEAEACMDPALVAQQHDVFTQATAKGITLFASSGDQGAAQPSCDGKSLMLSASTPASDPQVTGVGGTHLLADAHSGVYSSESVWNDDFGAGGGGFSEVYRRPGYQAPLQDNNKQRGVPDVAYDGDVRGGVVGAWSVLCGTAVNCGPTNLGFFVFGGTSAGTPQWAGIVALADQKGGHRLGAINKTLYHIGKSDAYGSAFHDITSGDNSFGGVTGFAAAAGWDAATGLGTPDVANLIPLLI